MIVKCDGRSAQAFLPLGSLRLEGSLPTGGTGKCHAGSRLCYLPFHLRLCPAGRLPRLSLRMAPASHSLGTEIPVKVARASTFTSRPSEARRFSDLLVIPQSGLAPRGLRMAPR